MGGWLGKHQGCLSVIKEIMLDTLSVLSYFGAAMRTPLTSPAEAYAPDADRAGPEGSAQQIPEWLVHLLARLIFVLLRSLIAAHLRRTRQMPPWWRYRPDLPPGSAQALAASIRGPFGNAIASMCRRHGIGPGHADWPELSRAIVAFGGSVKGFRAGAPAFGLQWWDNPRIVPGIVSNFVAPTASSPQRNAVADASPAAPNAMRSVAAPAMWPASWQRYLAPAEPVRRARPGRPPHGRPIRRCLPNGARAWLAPPS